MSQNPSPAVTLPAPPRLFRRLLLSFTGLGCFSVLAGGGWLAEEGTKRLIVPWRYPDEPWMTDFKSSPAAHGMKLQSFQTLTADGFRLNALMAEPSDAPVSTSRTRPVQEALRRAGIAPASAASARGTILLLHGYSGRKEHMLPVAERLCAAGFRCVMYDSRAHGESGGVYATFGAKETEDLRRVIAEAQRVAGPSGLGTLGMLGYSMGGAVALQAQPGLPEVKALCTVAAFAEFSGVISGQAAGRWGNASLSLLPALRLDVKRRAGFDPWSIRPVKSAARLTCPLFLAHGSLDKLIPAEQCDALEKAAGKNCVEKYIVPGAGHSNVFTAGGDELWRRVALFFTEHMKA